MDTVNFDELAAAARPIDDADWGSDRQINAQNAFFDAIEARYPNLFDNDFGSFAIKATTKELIDEALKLVKQEMNNA